MPATRAGGSAAQLSLELPAGVSAVGDWNRPPGAPSPRNSDDRILIGSGTFTRELKGSNPGKGTIKISIAYQVCNEQMCLPLSEVTRTLAWDGN